MLFVENVTIPELLESVYNQINSLLASFKNNNRNKREAKNNDENKMDCKTFLKVLDLFEQLQKVAKDPALIVSNHQEIEKLSNEIQMYSAFPVISQESCQNLESSIHQSINQKVRSTKTFLGKFQRSRIVISDPVRIDKFHYLFQTFT